RPGQSDAWAEISLRRVKRIATRITQHAGNNVKVNLPVIRLLQWRVVLVTQTIAQSKIWLDLPFILRIADVVFLLGIGWARGVVKEWRRRRQISEHLC